MKTIVLYPILTYRFVFAAWSIYGDVVAIHCVQDTTRRRGSLLTQLDRIELTLKMREALATFCRPM